MLIKTKITQLSHFNHLLVAPASVEKSEFIINFKIGKGVNNYMLKKIIGAAAGAGLVLTMAGTTLAYEGFNFPHFGFGSDELKIENYADVDANVHQYATSGDNEIEGRSGRIDTGESDNYLELRQDVNYTELGDCGCFDDVDIDNDADVDADVHQDATSGDNKIESEEKNSHQNKWSFWFGGHHGNNNDGEAVIETGRSRNTAYVDQFVNTTIMAN